MTTRLRPRDFLIRRCGRFFWGKAQGCQRLPLSRWALTRSIARGLRRASTRHAPRRDSDRRWLENSPSFRRANGLNVVTRDRVQQPTTEIAVKPLELDSVLERGGLVGLFLAPPDYGVLPRVLRITPRRWIPIAPSFSSACASQAVLRYSSTARRGGGFALICRRANNAHLGCFSLQQLGSQLSIYIAYRDDK
jgi:hypothetical protein